MKLLRFIFLLVLLTAPALAQNPVSVRSTNGVAINLTNVGLTANGQITTEPGNLIFTNNLVTLTCSLFSQTVTVASGVLTNLFKDNGVGATFIVNGNQQYSVAGIIDSTHFSITQKAVQAFTGVNPVMNPPAAVFNDTTDATTTGGAIDGGGCIHVLMNNQIGGIFLHDQNDTALDGWLISSTQLDSTPAFSLYSFRGNNNPFQVSAQALYNSLCVRQNFLSVRNPIVNEFGDLILGGGSLSLTTNIQARGGLGVTGNLKAATLQQTTGATAGAVLVSDATGLASWSTSPTVTVSQVGVTNGSNAAAGIVGEYFETNSGLTFTNLTSSQAATIATLSLTAGDWDVTGNGIFQATSATTLSGSSATINISTNVTYTSAEAANAFILLPNITLTTFAFNGAVPRRRFNLTNTTTVFLRTSILFSAGTITAGGNMSARRVR